MSPNPPRGPYGEPHVPYSRVKQLVEMLVKDYTVLPPGTPDPRDARIAELEAALRESRRYVERTQGAPGFGEPVARDVLERIDTLLGGRG